MSFSPVIIQYQDITPPNNSPLKTMVFGFKVTAMVIEIVQWPIVLMVKMGNVDRG